MDDVAVLDRDIDVEQQANRRVPLHPSGDVGIEGHAAQLVPNRERT